MKRTLLFLLIVWSATVAQAQCIICPQDMCGCGATSSQTICWDSVDSRYEPCNVGRATIDETLLSVQTHATDCTALTCDAASDGELCFEQDADTLYTCDGSGTPAWKVASPDTPLCMSYPLYTACNMSGSITCTVSGAGCVGTTNLATVGAHGPAIGIDFDTFTHCRLRYGGAIFTGQTGTVTVRLQNFSTSTTDITTSWSSGTTCADRSSSVTDLTANAGVDYVGLELGDSDVNDDPLLTGIVLTCCDQTFTF